MGISVVQSTHGKCSKILKDAKFWISNFQRHLLLHPTDTESMIRDVNFFENLQCLINITACPQPFSSQSCKQYKTLHQFHLMHHLSAIIIH